MQDVRTEWTAGDSEKERESLRFACGAEIAGAFSVLHAVCCITCVARAIDGRVGLDACGAASGSCSRPF